MILFVGSRGRAYEAEQVRPVVLALLRRRWRGMLRPGWIARVDTYLKDPAWLLRHNGEVPAALARDLDLTALHGYPPEY